jgi:hypothetical protein
MDKFDRRQFFLGFGWTIFFFVVAAFFCLIVVSAVVSLPLLADGQKDTLLRVAATIGAFRGSPSIWLALILFSVIFGVGGAYFQVLPASDNASIERYLAAHAELADDGSPIACTNCGRTVTEQHCGHCGQERAVSLRPAPTLGGFVSHIIPDVVNVDVRFLKSLWTLFIKPGVLTVEYLRGRRVSYSPPTQLYFVVAAAFFVVSGSLDFNVEGLMKGSKALEAKIERTAREEHVTTEVVVERLNDGLQTYLPFYTFVMVVVFAAILKLLYRSERYVNHLIFSLHFIAAFLLFWMLLIAALLLAPALSKYDFIVTIPSGLYLLVALRRVHPSEPSWLLAPAVACFVALFFIYTTISIAIISL